jgi:hypothetical protein
VFIRNVKTFNTIVGYKTDLPDGVSDYNQDLIKALKNTTQFWEAKLNITMIPLKADYLAERSIPDNIEEEGSQNAYIIVISYLMMFVYVSVAIGFFPSKIHNKFLLGCAGIFVVITALISAIGITFYALVPLSMISAEEVFPQVSPR